MSLFKAFNGFKYLSKIQKSLHPALNLTSENFPLFWLQSHCSLFFIKHAKRTSLGGLCPFLHSLECSSTSFKSPLNNHLRRQGFSDHTSPPSSFSFPHSALFCSLHKVPIYMLYVYLTFSIFSNKMYVPGEAESSSDIFMVRFPATVITW